MEKFEFKKSLGQNFINDDNIINKIIDVADIDKDTLVIEIGPGAGSLSKKIIPLSGFSILYEVDTRLRETLSAVLNGNNNYQIIFNDFLKQDVKNDIISYNYKKIYVVANLPYYITTPIITKLMKEIYPDKIVIMIQDEVADRLSASHGSRNYGMISTLLSSRYKIKKQFKVSRNCFNPVPNVDSAVISLIKNEEYEITDFDKFENFIKAAFRFKRKNLKNNLNGYNLDAINRILNRYNYDLTYRAEDIPVNIFIEIVNNL